MWWGASIGRLFNARKKADWGDRPAMLVGGLRKSIVVTTSATSSTAPTRLFGSRMSEAKNPAGPASAMLLPWCGTQMKMLRRTFLSRSKIRESRRTGALGSRPATRGASSPKIPLKIALPPELDACAREMMPPMLCPTSTSPRGSGYRASAARRSLRRSSAEIGIG